LFENRKKEVKRPFLVGFVVDWVQGEFANQFSTLMQGFVVPRSSEAAQPPADYQGREARMEIAWWG